MNFPHLEVWELKDTCALDVADRGYKQLQAVGDAIGITRERVRQIEFIALQKLKAHLSREMLEGFLYNDSAPAIFDTSCRLDIYDSE